MISLKPFVEEMGFHTRERESAAQEKENNLLLLQREGKINEARKII